MGEHKSGRRWHWTRRLGAGVALVLLFYTAFLLLGFCPVNRKYIAPPVSERVVLFVRSNEIHSDLVMPVRDEATGIDWCELFPPEDFLGDVKGADYVAVGWGNREFYVETPRWASPPFANNIPLLKFLTTQSIIINS